MQLTKLGLLEQIKQHGKQLVLLKAFRHHKDYALTKISGNDPLIPNPAWDLVAAINLSERSFCPETHLHIEVNTDGKPEVNQGQTVAIPNQPLNTNVCLNPSLANLPFTSQELFLDKAKP
ncbi:hypothetical protein [Nostoc sp.]|uniref:hypothetical protein n=1 Tax=Nostoc sp. TaxID=1180 RepID=UPI002FF79035